MNRNHSLFVRKIIKIDIRRGRYNVKIKFTIFSDMFEFARIYNFWFLAIFKEFNLIFVCI